MASKVSPACRRSRNVWLTSASTNSPRAVAEAVARRRCALRLFERRRRRIDAHHLRSRRRPSGDAEAAGVAVAVEHAPASELAHPLRRTAAVVALVEVEAGLVAGGHVERQRPVVLADRHLAWRPRRAASRRAAPALRACARRSRCARSRRDKPVRRSSASAIGVAPTFHARRQELHAQHVGITVDDQPRQTVGLAVHQAHAVAGDRQGARAARSPRPAAARRTRRRCARLRRSSRRARGSTSAGCRRPRRESGRRAACTRTVSPESAPPLSMLPSNTHGWRRSSERSLLSRSRMTFMVPDCPMPSPTHPFAGTKGWTPCQRRRTMRAPTPGGGTP